MMSNGLEVINMRDKDIIRRELLKLAKETLEHELMMADREELNFGIHDELLEFESRTSILPIYISESPTKVATEIILCSSVNGMDEGINGMPREITITRKILNGKEYKAKYVMFVEKR